MKFIHPLLFLQENECQKSNHDCVVGLKSEQEVVIEQESIEPCSDSVKRMSINGVKNI